MGEKRKQSPAAHRLARGDELYPGVLLTRLGENAPAALTAIGPVALLANRKTALLFRPPAIGKPFCLCGTSAVAFVAMAAIGHLKLSL